MQVRPAHLAVAALTAVAALASGGSALGASTAAADKPVSRFTAYQACQAAMWRWTAENAEEGSSVGSFRHRYRAADVWREGSGWHVQVGGRRGEQERATDDVAWCVITGTNAEPKLRGYVFPR